LTIGPGAASLLTSPLRAAAAKPAGREGTREGASPGRRPTTHKEKKRMTRTKSILGLLIGAALCFAAFGASNASAATLHECTLAEETSTAARYEDSECKNEAGGGFFATTPISGKQNVKATNTGNFTLTAVVAGVHFVITATGMESVEGWAENDTSLEGNMTVRGASKKVKYTGVTLHSEEPGLEGCTVPGTLETGEVESMTEGMGVKYTPVGSTIFIEIPVSGCENTTLNGVKKVKGSARSEAESGTSTTTQEFSETSGSELTFAGQKAKFLGKYHLTTENGTPLHLETP
jgi:hypothetical protein